LGGGWFIGCRRGPAEKQRRAHGNGHEYRMRTQDRRPLNSRKYSQGVRC
jgi:hypothetical protein